MLDFENWSIVWSHFEILNFCHFTGQFTLFLSQFGPKCLISKFQKWSIDRSHFEIVHFLSLWSFYWTFPSQFCQKYLISKSDRSIDHISKSFIFSHFDHFTGHFLVNLVKNAWFRKVIDRSITFRNRSFSLILIILLDIS